ncbi:MAG: nuclear transport factor 2 family protein [Candidatus Dormiibacterota bacterium]
MDTRTSSGLALAQRLHDAVNRHDLEALAGCFAQDFVNETPVHPARSFYGREQVRKNWAQIFSSVPDIEADMVRSSVDGNAVWTEWEMRGARCDGVKHLMRGVSIFEVGEGEFTSVRFYLERVEDGGIGVDAAVKQAVGR